jgi:hypothetical protein
VSLPGAGGLRDRLLDIQCASAREFPLRARTGRFAGALHQSGLAGRWLGAAEHSVPEHAVCSGHRLVGFTVPTVSTPWIEVDGAYNGECSSADNANVLQITGVPGAPQLHAFPDATWGLHLVDANIALGNLVDVVHQQARAFKHHKCHGHSAGKGNGHGNGRGHHHSDHSSDQSGCSGGED